MLEGGGLAVERQKVRMAVLAAWAVFEGRESVLLERCERDPTHVSVDFTDRFLKSENQQA